MLCFINTHLGFVQSHRIVANKYHKLSYCTDVREAMPFTSKEQAEKFIAPLVETLPPDSRWWAVLFSSNQSPQHTPPLEFNQLPP